MDLAKKKVMVGIGEILWDIFPQGKEMGGAPANFAYHASQLGNRGVVISCVGQDEEGAGILKTLRKKGIEHMIAEVEGYPTGTVTVSMDGEGLPTYRIHENVAWDHLELNAPERELAPKADVVCYGTLAQRNRDSAAAIQHFIALTSPRCHRIFDINLRQHYYSRQGVLALLELSSILKLNDDELTELTMLCDLSGGETDILRQLRTRFALDYVILTRGAQGSRIYGGGSRDSQLRGQPVKVVDTVGAGDSFTAAVATGLCRGMSLAEIHPFAARVAAYVCNRAGATPVLPPLQKLLYD